MKIVKMILTGLVALVFIGSASGKLIPGDASNEMATHLGGATNVMMLGCIELLIVLLWFIPRTSLLGGFVAIAYMGGATAVHVVTHQPVIALLVIQAIIWTTIALRFPETTTRLKGN
jgi:hypothetical protein